MWGKSPMKHNKQEQKLIVPNILSGSLAACLLTITASINSAQAEYAIKDLGTFGNTFSQGWGINNSGQVTGNSRITGTSNQHAFFYDGSSMQDIGFLDGTSSYGKGINDSGQITGDNSGIPLGENSITHRAFIYSNGVMQNLGTLGGNSSNAYDINNNGDVVGYSSIATNNYSHAFRYSNGVMQDLGTLGGARSFGRDINDSGQVVGYSDTTGTGDHAFLYSGGIMHDLGTLGGTDSWATGINNNGLITGYSNTVGYTETRAYIYSGGVMQNLGTLGGNDSRGNAINIDGHVVGNSKLANGEWTAFLYDGTDMLDLCVLTDCVNNGWERLTAFDINDSGDITGIGYIDGTYHAYIISSVPVPAAVWLFGSGLIGLIGFAKRKARV